MKKIVLLLLILVNIMLIISCSETYNYAGDVHKQAGVWQIEKIEHFVWDSLTNDFKLSESADEPGYFHLYDNDNTSTIAYLNNCHYVIDDTIQLWAPQALAQITTSKWIYWFCENNRLTLWAADIYSEIGVVYTIKKIGLNKQEWSYFMPVGGGIFQKEMLTLVHKSH